MKIAVASSSKKTDGQIATQGGRAPFYLIFDETGSLVETVKNPFAVGGGGAGFGVAKMLADKHVNVVIAGKLGGKMVDALAQRDLRGEEMDGSISEAVARVRKS